MDRLKSPACQQTKTTVLVSAILAQVLCRLLAQLFRDNCGTNRQHIVMILFERLLNVLLMLYNGHTVGLAIRN